jgi:alanine racemase
MTDQDVLSATTPELLIDLSAITKNWRTFDTLATAKTAAVVKANAYGTGMVEAARALERIGCGVFFVATPTEGAVLRAALPDPTIYVLAGLTVGSERDFFEYDLIPVLNDLEQTGRWGSLCARHGSRPAAVHVDTGMNRLGIHHKHVEALVDALKRWGIDLALVMSHLACADQPTHPLNATQLERFRRVLRFLPGVDASLCGSAGVLLGPDYHFDLVRPGVGLFGGNPVRDLPTMVKHVVSVRAPILQVHSLEDGDTAGYGARYRANGTRVLATVAVGYADGFPRTLSNRGIALVDGVPTPYVGTVSMDSIILDVSEVDPVKGDVEMLGPGLTVDRLAELASTIPNEILSGLGGRLVRRYVEDRAGLATRSSE